MSLVGPLALGAVLLAIIWCDLRYMKIPNLLVLVLVGLFVAKAMLMPDRVMLGEQLILAGAVFAIGFVMFALRLMGGGDTKVLPALVLFVPLAFLPQVMIVFSVMLILGTLAVIGLRRVLGAREASDWAFLRTKRMPMGLPIGLAGLVTLVLATA